MPLQFFGNSPDVNANGLAIKNAAAMTLSDNPIVSQSNTVSQTQTGEIRNRSAPIEKIGLDIEIQFTTGATTTINPMGALNYIQNFKVKTDSQDVLVNLPGWMLPFVHQEYNAFDVFPYYEVATQAAPTVPLAYNAAIAVSTAYVLRAYIEIPFDVGGYQSLLDPTLFSIVNLEATFGAPADFFGATVGTIQSAKITPRVSYITGFNRGERGGVGFQYLKNRIGHIVKPLTQTQSELEIDLLPPGRAYHGVTLFTRAQTAGLYGLADGVIDNAGLRRAGTWLHKLNNFQTKARQYGTVCLPNSTLFGAVNQTAVTGLSLLTGVNRLPLVESEHFDQVVVTKVGETMQVMADITSVANNAQVVELFHYFA